jgi:nucleotide-binding universal stress UspA family protein
MLDIRRILCPIDFSDGSRHALEHAVVMAGWYGSHLTALHVVNPVFTIESSIPFADFEGPVPTAADREALRERVCAWLEPARRVGVGAEALLDDGKPAADILERAASMPADLVVMGTHGRSGFERWMLGSVTEKVLRKATCPVLTVPPPTVSTSKLPFKQLLCPVDLSESSISGLQSAFSIAQESAARITILHVFEWMSDDQLVARRASELSESQREWERQTRQRLEALISDDVRNWCAPEPMLRYGKPYRQVLTVAEEEHADLIVMGVHGRNVLDVMLFGSTTNQVVRQASCPVLTLRR